MIALRNFSRNLCSSLELLMRHQKLFWTVCFLGACCFYGCDDESYSLPIDQTPAAECGNGVKEIGEICDDGNLQDGDGCSADCKRQESGYTCPETGGTCNPNEADSKCGNLAIDEGEFCDDGNHNSGDGCSSDCKVIEDGFTCPSSSKGPLAGPCYKPGVPEEPVETGPRCGNRILEPQNGEECDYDDWEDGPYDGDGCDSNCKVESGFDCSGGTCVEIYVPGCGNGKLDDGEDCDYGDPQDPYNAGKYGTYGLAEDQTTPLCNPNTCKFAPYCGDGNPNEGYEECDKGAENQDELYNGCTTQCKRGPYCGDGVFTSGAEEKCDYAIEGASEWCNEDCTPKEGYMCNAQDGTCKEKNKIKCGDSYIEGNEECDQSGNGCNNCQHDNDYKCISSLTAPCTNCTGSEPSNYPCCTSTAGQQCRNIADGYGDGILDPDGFEECDDGNKNDGDGCSSVGKIEDGFVCRATGKPCDTICGDGKKVGKEECDDGNHKGGDGCSPECKQEIGYVCQTPGKACELDKCGNGFVGPNEICDGGAGCGSDCKSLRSGYCYSKSQGVYSCGSSNTCGNYILEPGEQCDDGNSLGGDGCSDSCTVEDKYFECPTGIECRAKCGDGKVMGQLDEKCDLGTDNGKGKGCSITCQEEPGFTCTKPSVSYPSTVNLDVTYRDFVGRNMSSGSGLVNSTVQNALNDSDCNRSLSDSEPTNFKSSIKGRISDLVPGQKWLKTSYGYPDFEGFAGDLCFGLVQNELDSEGKPVFNGNLNDNCCGSMTASQCSAFIKGGSYNGAKYPTYVGGESVGWHHVSKLSKRHHMLCAKSFAKWYRTDNIVSKEVKTVLPLTKVYNQDDPSKASPYVFDSDKTPYNKYFSPIDGQGWNEKNTIYQHNHNGNFTTEISTMFQYGGGETLNFAGDDDVWVFINGKLFLDVGGMHAKVEGENTLSTKKCTSQDKKNGGTVERVCDEKYNIYQGGIYELKVFHAERASSGADFKLTLDGFVSPDTVTCSSVCGDGVIASDEECEIKGHTNDDVAQKLGCVDCKWTNTSTCGNGRIEGNEACDTGYLCKDSKFSEACTALGLSYAANDRCDETTCKYKDNQCGNGVVDPGEDCDSSDPLCNSKSCKWYCGDGIVQAEKGEECDEGSKSNETGETCSTKCKAPYCGDGVVSPYHGEVCDDGKNNTTYGEGCMPGCMRKAPFCGDGILQKEHNEECDLGKDKNNGSYGGCTEECRRASYCGDGKVDEANGEECDDKGESALCNANCVKKVN